MVARKPRPTSRTTEIDTAILARLAAGETLRGICKSPGMPINSVVIGWCNADPVFAERYARARREGLDVLAEEIISIADTQRKGVKSEEKHVAWICPACRLEVRWLGSKWVHTLNGTVICEGVKKPERVTEVKTTTGDTVERARLQVDARKWLLSKLRPDKYGDRTQMELTGKDGGPAELIIRFPEPPTKP